MIVTDEIVEKAWAAIVGADVAPVCFQASIIRADLRTALEAALTYLNQQQAQTTSSVTSKDL